MQEIYSDNSFVNHLCQERDGTGTKEKEKKWTKKTTTKLTFLGRGGSGCDFIFIFFITCFSPFLPPLSLHILCVFTFLSFLLYFNFSHCYHISWHFGNAVRCRGFCFSVIPRSYGRELADGDHTW